MITSPWRGCGAPRSGLFLWENYVPGHFQHAFNDLSWFFDAETLISTGGREGFCIFSKNSIFTASTSRDSIFTHCWYYFGGPNLQKSLSGGYWKTPFLLIPIFLMFCRIFTILARNKKGWSGQKSMKIAPKCLQNLAWSCFVDFSKLLMIVHRCLSNFHRIFRWFSNDSISFWISFRRPSFANTASASLHFGLLSKHFLSTRVHPWPFFVFVLKKGPQMQ